MSVPDNPIYGVMDPEDVQTVVKSLAPDIYTAEDLYARYAYVVHAAGRLPAHPVALGRELARLGYPRRAKFERSRGKKGYQVKAWLIAHTVAPSPDATPIPVTDSGPSDTCRKCDFPLGDSSKPFGLCFKCRSGATS